MVVDWGDVATWMSGLATTAAVGFAAVQLREFRALQQRDRRIELAGVSVEWRLRQAPDPVVDGVAQSHYVFALMNPGRLPVTHVDVEISVPIPVQLVDSDGTVRPPTTSFRLDTPVVAGASVREWWRTLRFADAEREGLRDMAAVVRFQDLDGRDHENRWGRSRPA